MNVPLRQYLRLLATYLRPQRARVALLAILLLGSIGLQLLNPQILRAFIDRAVAGDAARTLTLIALLFIGVALLQQALVVVATYLSENVGWTATNALRIDLTAHCLRLDMPFHKARTPGEMIERIDGDVTALSNFFSQLVINVLSNMLLLAGVLLLLFREDWRIGLGLTMFSLIALFVLVRMRSIAVPYWAAVREASATFFGFLGEQLAGTEDVRANGATAYVMHRFYMLLRGWLPLQRKASLAGYSMWLTTLAIFSVGNAIAFALGGYLYSAGAITIGTVFLIFYYTELLGRPIEQIRTQLEDLQKAGASIRRVEELFAVQPHIADGPGVPLPSGALAVEFRNVSFGYEEEQRTENKEQWMENQEPRTENSALTTGQRPPTMDDGRWTTDDGQATMVDGLQSMVGRGDASPLRALRTSLDSDHNLVLRGISFRLAPGQVLGLLGRTGSGKTTLARLLLRLYDPISGVVRLGDVTLDTTDMRDLRQRVAVVTQDVQLFHATVRDNLTFFNPTISDEQILTVLDELGLGAWLRSLPNGLDTELASDGSGLSAGEAQLLAFVRVFLKNPGLVILDEASSRLDPATEHLIERAIDKLLQGRTAIIIAHRLRTVQRADAIMILEKGRILEYGARAELARDPGSRFAQLVQTGLEEVLA